MRRLTVLSLMIWVSGNAMAQTADPAAAAGPTGGEVNMATPAPADAAAATSGAAADKPTDKDASWDEGKEPGGLFGPVRVGPTLAIGFPHVVNYGIDVLWENMIGFAIATGKTKVETFKPLSAEISNLDARLRWFPFKSSFFLGAAYGTQKVSANAVMNLKTTIGGTVMKVPTEFEAEAETTYWTPHLGFFSIWDIGLTIGFELGAQLAVKSHTELDVTFKNLSAAQEAEMKSSKVYLEQKEKTREALKKIASETIPYVTLIRVGYMF